VGGSQVGGLTSLHSKTLSQKLHLIKQRRLLTNLFCLPWVRVTSLWYGSSGLWPHVESTMPQPPVQLHQTWPCPLFVSHLLLQHEAISCAASGGVHGACRPFLPQLTGAHMRGSEGTGQPPARFHSCLTPLPMGLRPPDPTFKM
jgi:hypothetical protein